MVSVTLVWRPTWSRTPPSTHSRHSLLDHSVLWPISEYFPLTAAWQAGDLQVHWDSPLDGQHSLACPTSLCTTCDSLSTLYNSTIVLSSFLLLTMWRLSARPRLPLWDLPSPRAVHPLPYGPYKPGLMPTRYPSLSPKYSSAA